MYLSDGFRKWMKNRRKKDAIEAHRRAQKEEEAENVEDKEIPYFVEKLCASLWWIFEDGNYRGKTTETEMFILGMDFVILARLHTFLNGEIDPLQ